LVFIRDEAMNQFFVSSLRAGVRGRSFQAVLVLGVLLVGVAYLAGFFSPRAPKTVALDVGFSGLRFSLVLLSLFWIQDLVGKEIDRRTVIFALAYPVPRSAYILGRYLGILVLSAIATVTLGLLLWLAVLLAGAGYDQEFQVVLGLPYWATLFGIWLDVAVVAAFALWIATLATVSILPLALGAAFAISGKSLGAVMDYLARGADGDKPMVDRYGPIIEFIQWVLPDLSRLDWRVWPLYSHAPGATAMSLSLLMALGYALLMLFLATHTFSRREFS
jgi:ABC-type transport system involved in multi-copper enzyme maturation permease subunit